MSSRTFNLCSTVTVLSVMPRAGWRLSCSQPYCSFHVYCARIVVIFPLTTVPEQILLAVRCNSLFSRLTTLSSPVDSSHQSQTIPLRTPTIPRNRSTEMPDGYFWESVGDWDDLNPRNRRSSVLLIQDSRYSTVSGALHA
jgi:hypothetical protein